MQGPSTAVMFRFDFCDRKCQSMIVEAGGFCGAAEKDRKLWMRNPHTSSIQRVDEQATPSQSEPLGL